MPHISLRARVKGKKLDVVLSIDELPHLIGWLSAIGVLSAVARLLFQG